MSKNEHSSPELATIAARVFNNDMDLDWMQQELGRGRYTLRNGEVLALLHLAQDAKKLAGSVLSQAADKPALPSAVLPDP